MIANLVAHFDPIDGLAKRSTLFHIWLPKFCCLLIDSVLRVSVCFPHKALGYLPSLNLLLNLVIGRLREQDKCHLPHFRYWTHAIATMISCLKSSSHVMPLHTNPSNVSHAQVLSPTTCSKQDGLDPRCTPHCSTCPHGCTKGITWTCYVHRRHEMDIVEGKVWMYVLGYYKMFLICKNTMDPSSRHENVNLRFSPWVVAYTSD